MGQTGFLEISREPAEVAGRSTLNEAVENAVGKLLTGG